MHTQIKEQGINSSKYSGWYNYSVILINELALVYNVKEILAKYLNKR